VAHIDRDRRKRENAESIRFGKGDLYAHLAKRPLHILVFLLPLVAAYELGAILCLQTPEQAQHIRAYAILSDLFGSLGVSTLHLPAILLLVVLIVWHVVSRDTMRIRPGVIAGMWVEAAVWTIPLLVLGLILAQAIGLVEPVTTSPPPAATAGTPDELAALPVGGRIAVSIGAGLYEELLFRLVGIALVHLVLADLLGMGKHAAAAIAIAVTSLAFAAYHDLGGPDAIDWARGGYYFVAGVYFALVYLSRGLGIAVAVHALYDFVILVRPFEP
jgi:hypothetical protein